MQQVLVIPGGNSFATYAEYLESLRDKTIDLAFGVTDDWKRSLPDALGPAYQVILPRMPNRDNARYEEWKLWFEKHLSLLSESPILIGHSLGGVFLAKYLAETTSARKIKATFLVAAPLMSYRENNQFVPPESLARLEEQGGEIFLYFSEDDAVVPYTELGLYRQQLPRAHVRSFSDRGHFNQETLPELVADIRSLT